MMCHFSLLELPNLPNFTQKLEGITEKHPGKLWKWRSLYFYLIKTIIAGKNIAFISVYVKYKSNVFDF